MSTVTGLKHFGELGGPKFWEKFVTCDSHEITTQKNAAAFATAPNYRTCACEYIQCQTNSINMRRQ
jgi:hypothetical protein